jgi:hypothetical protein
VKLFSVLFMLVNYV